MAVVSCTNPHQDNLKAAQAAVDAVDLYLALALLEKVDKTQVSAAEYDQVQTNIELLKGKIEDIKRHEAAAAELQYLIDNREQSLDSLRQQLGVDD